MKLSRGRDGVIGSIRIKCGRSMPGRAMQHLYPMELSCNLVTEMEKGPAILTVNTEE